MHRCNVFHHFLPKVSSSQFNAHFFNWHSNTSHHIQSNTPNVLPQFVLSFQAPALSSVIPCKLPWWLVCDSLCIQTTPVWQYSSASCFPVSYFPHELIKSCSFWIFPPLQTPVPCRHAGPTLFKWKIAHGNQQMLNWPHWIASCFFCSYNITSIKIWIFISWKTSLGKL